MRPVGTPPPYRVRQNGIAADSGTRAGHWELAQWDNPGACNEQTIVAWYRSLSPSSTNEIGGNWNSATGGVAIEFGTAFFNSPSVTWYTQSQYSRVEVNENLSGRDLVIAARYSVARNQRSLWFDGAVRDTDVTDGQIRTHSGPITLCAHAGSTTNRIDGSVYTIALWSRALSDSDILALLRNPFAAAVQERRSRVVHVLRSAVANGNAAGVTLASTVSVITGAATGAAARAGVVLTTTPSLIAGTATGSAATTGVTLADTVTFVAGGASAGVLASGTTLTATSSLITGAAVGAAAAAGRTITATLSFSSGFVSGGGLSAAPGTQITVTATLTAGAASTFATSQVASRFRIGSAVMRANRNRIRH